jgi:hypothetical protein
MSRFDVFRILGEPARSPARRLAGYPDRGGRVNFDDAGAVLSWRLPPGLLRPAAATGR